MREKVRLAVVITRLVRGGAQRIALETYRRLDPVRYEKFFLCGPDLGPEGGLIAEANAAGVFPIIVPRLHREIAPAADLAATVWLTQFLRNRGIEVLHVHTSKAGFIGALAGRLARTPAVVYTPHGHIFASGARIPGVDGRLRRAALLRLRRLAERWSDRVVALGREDLESQVALGLAPREKYVVVPNGVDLARYDVGTGGAIRDRLRRVWRVPEGRSVVAVVGRLTSEKGQDVLIRAIALLLDRQDPPVLVIAGGGPEEASLRSLAGTLDITPHVRFLGSREDVPAILAAADIVAVPSRYESAGLAAMEAMAAGRPVVASRTGGIPDLIRDGIEGLLVPPGDPRPLAGAIRRLMDDRGLVERMAASGRERIRRDHGIDRSAAILQGLYEHIVASKGIR